MKICQINTVYGRGSTGKLVWDIHRGLLDAGDESIAIYAVKTRAVGHGVYAVSDKFLSRVSAVFRRVSGRIYGGAFLQTHRLLRILRREKPDVVHLHCLNGNNFRLYRILRYLADRKIRTVLTLHAEFMFTGGCGHALECDGYLHGCGKCPQRKNMRIALDRSASVYRSLKRCYDRFDPDKFVYAAVSPWLLERAQKAPLLAKFRGVCVPNGVDTGVYCPDYGAAWRRAQGIAPDEKLLFFAGANFDSTRYDAKGGKYVCDVARILQREGVRVAVAAEYSTVGTLPPNLLFLGRIESPTTLSACYAAADLSLVTSVRETFGMPVAESLCCGTPVVGFMAGGPESIALPAYSDFCRYGDVQALVELVRKRLSDPVDHRAVAAAAAKTYGTKTMLESYRRLYRGEWPADGAAE